MNLFQRRNNHKTVKIGCMASWFIISLLREITSEKCVNCGFCDNLKFFRELFPERKKSSLEKFVSSILNIYIHNEYNVLKCCSSSQKCHFVKFRRILKYMYTTEMSCNIRSLKCGRKLIFDTSRTLFSTNIKAIFENIASKVSTSGLYFLSKQRLKEMSKIHSIFYWENKLSCKRL